MRPSRRIIVIVVQFRRPVTRRLSAASCPGDLVTPLFRKRHQIPTIGRFPAHWAPAGESLSAVIQGRHQTPTAHGPLRPPESVLSGTVWVFSDTKPAGLVLESWVFGDAGEATAPL